MSEGEKVEVVKVVVHSNGHGRVLLSNGMTLCKVLGVEAVAHPGQAELLIRVPAVTMEVQSPAEAAAEAERRHEPEYPQES